MTKIFYTVKMIYCGGRLGISKAFDRFSKAQEYALNWAKDEDNTDIIIEEIEVKGIFKKTYTSKILKIYNEEK